VAVADVLTLVTRNARDSQPGGNPEVLILYQL